MGKKFVLSLCLFLTHSILFAQPGASDVSFNTNDAGFGTGYGVDGASEQVNSFLKTSNGNILLGGSFERYNEFYTPDLTQIFSNGIRNAGFNVPLSVANGVTEIRSMIESTDGSIYVAGKLDYLINEFGQNKRYYGIVRLNSNGSLHLSSRGFSDNGEVYAMAKESGESIIVAGGFTTYNGSKFITGIARLNGSTWDPFFNPETGGNSSFTAVAIQTDGKILAAGYFNFFNGLPNGVIRLNADGSIDNSFTLSNGANGNVSNILVQPDGKIIVAGSFTSYNGTARNGIIRLNSDGTFDNTFGNPSTGTNTSLTGAALQADGKIVIGGYMPTLTGTTIIKNSILRLNINGTTDNTFSSGSTANNETINSIYIQTDGKILIGGKFTFYNNKPLNDVIRLNTNGTIDATFNTPSGVVGPTTLFTYINTINIQPDQKIIAGGKFNSYNSNNHNNLLRINPDGSADPSFSPGIPMNNSENFDYIAATALQSDGKIVVSGEFTLAGTTTRSNMARLNANGSIDNAFNAGSGTSSPARNIRIQQNGKILIAGNFTSYNGSPFNYIVRLNSDGSVDNTFNIGSGANNIINAIALQTDGKIIIVGNFTTFNETTRNYIARLNTDGSIDNTFNIGTGTNLSIETIALQTDGKIIISGIFTSYNGTTRNRIARLNGDGSIDNTFNPGTGPNTGGAITRLAIQSDGKVLIAGSFTSFNGTPSVTLARLNQDGTIDNTFQSGVGVNSSILTMVIQEDEKILLGGQFNQYNNTGRNRIARILKCQPDVLTRTSAAGTDNQSVCSSLPITNITYSASGGASGATVSGLPTGVTGTYNSGVVTISGTSTAVGSYDYKVSTTGGCSVFTTGKIIINPRPDISVNSPSICAGDSATLTVSGTANTFSWSPSTGLRPTTGATIKASPAITTVYTVTATISSTGCQNTAQSTVTIKPKPAITATSSNATSCGTASGNITLNGLTANTAYTVNYTRNTVPASAQTFSANANGIITLNLVAGTYSNIFVTLNGCTSNIVGPFTITEPTPPTLTVPSSNVVVCATNPSGNISFSASPAGATINWTNNNASIGLPVSGTGSISSFNTINNGTTVQNATLNVTATQNGCTSAAKSISIIVNPRPQISVNSPSICAGDSATLTVTGNANTFTWSPTTGLRPTTGAVIKASPSNTTTYTVTATFTSTGCQNTAQGTVTVKTIPAKPIITLNGNQLISSSASGNQWYLNGGILTGQNAQSIVPAQSGSYTVLVTTNGCSSQLSDPYNYIATGQNDFFENEFIKLFPNPVKDELSVQYYLNELNQQMDLKIYAITGKMLQAFPIARSNTKINIDALPTGQYFIMLESKTSHRRFMYKIIKTN